jgi:hypothetical protein
MRRPTTLGRARLRLTGIRRRSSTLCGGKGFLARESSKFQPPDIRHDSSKRRRSTHPQRHRHLSILAILAVPLKALVSQINYNLFDLEVTAQQSQFAYLQAKDLADSVDGLLRTHDVALWNGSDTSLSSPTTLQYFGVIGQIAAGGNTATVAVGASIVNSIKTTIATMVSNAAYSVRPTAVYANPVTLDLIDQEMKTEYNVVLNTVDITGGFRVKALTTQAGELPLIPDWTIPYTPGAPGSAVYPVYIVTEDLIEYHWLSDPNPRVFKLGLPNALTQQMVVVKFGAPVVKGANFAHYQVNIER